MANNVYAEIPVLENERFILRGINKQKDAEDLLQVYSDEKAVPLFNSDNCHGDDFHYITMEQMQKALEFWEFSYRERYFVRWTVEDKLLKAAIGTIELFNRRAEDYFNNCGLLRLDLRSDYETRDCVESILSLIVPSVKEMFGCDKIATKAVACAKERIAALECMNFCLSAESLVGQDGTRYDSYYVLEV